MPITAKCGKKEKENSGQVFSATKLNPESIRDGIRRLLEKPGAKNAAGLIKYAIKNGLID